MVKDRLRNCQAQSPSSAFRAVYTIETESKVSASALISVELFFS